MIPSPNTSKEMELTAGNTSQRSNLFRVLRKRKKMEKIKSLRSSLEIRSNRWKKLIRKKKIKMGRIAWLKLLWERKINKKCKRGSKNRQKRHKKQQKTRKKHPKKKDGCKSASAKRRKPQGSKGGRSRDNPTAVQARKTKTANGKAYLNALQRETPLAGSHN